MPCPDSATAAQAALAGGTMDNMGIGLLGADGTTLKRKFRFLFGIQPNCKSAKAVSPSFVKTASRPDITIEDTEISFLNEVAWIPGKAKWETITVTYYDAAGAANAGLYSWLRSVYDFAGCRKMGGKPADYAGVATLVMLDGCGQVLEQWKMNNCWPTSIKFGEVDYSSSDIAEVELTLRYSQVEYRNFCGPQPSEPCCTPCS